MARSTFDCSRAPPTRLPAPPVPGAPMTADPDVGVCEDKPPFTLASPSTLPNCASATCAKLTVLPFVKLAEIVPSALIAMLLKEPGAAPFWVVAETLLVSAKPVTDGDAVGVSNCQVILEFKAAPLVMAGSVTPVGGMVKFANAGSVDGADQMYASVVAKIGDGGGQDRDIKNGQ